MFPQDKQGFAIDDQYYIGNSGLLVKPVTAPDVQKTDVYIAEAQVRPLFTVPGLSLTHCSRHTMTIKTTTFTEALSLAGTSQCLHHLRRSRSLFEADTLSLRANGHGALLPS
jgi:hypothetical protein